MALVDAGKPSISTSLHCIRPPGAASVTC